MLRRMFSEGSLENNGPVIKVEWTRRSSRSIVARKETILLARTQDFMEKIQSLPTNDLPDDPAFQVPCLMALPRGAQTQSALPV